VRRVTVGLGERAYEVAVGRGLLRNPAAAGRAAEALRDRRVFLAADRTVWGMYGEALRKGLERLGAQVVGQVCTEPGEVNKHLPALSRLWDGLVDAGVERRDALVALGGGVLGDLAGFAAATYLRGIDFVQVPTTLLAMVDSSVGGKTGIDHPRGKNLLGAFHQPRGVLADLEVLATLPRRELLSGLAEILKAGLLADRELFRLLEEKGPAVVDEPDLLEEAVARAVAIKARLVEEDEREAGARALLNLGHTLGHAVEVATGYGTWTHGEAVAMGIAFAARVSRELGILDPGEAKRIQALVEKWGYPLRATGIDAEKILDALRFDKKGRGGAPRWVLLRGIGCGEWGLEVPPDMIRRQLTEVQRADESL